MSGPQKYGIKSSGDGLQKDLAVDIKKTILRLQVDPEVFALRYRNIHIIHTSKFPFSIHFYIDEPNKRIVITNIIHDKMDVDLGLS